MFYIECTLGLVVAVVSCCTNIVLVLAFWTLDTYSKPFRYLKHREILSAIDNAIYFWKVPRAVWRDIYKHIVGSVLPSC